MRILLLPGAFKGSLSALKAGQILTKTLQSNHTVRCFPISDGGDGFIDTFSQLDPKATLIKVCAKNAFLKTKSSSFLMLSDHKTAVLETARICGLGSAKQTELDPLNASSYGVGQVILEALKHNAKTIYIGLGGVACNDGGAGMAVACQAQLFNKSGNEIGLGAQALLKVDHADFSKLKKQLRNTKIIGAADVTNSLLGSHSCAKVFGPQKGATPSQVKILDRAMTRWAHLIEQTSGRKTAHTPSTAAAGGIAAGLYGCFNAKLMLGADFLIKKASLEKHIRWADLIVTSEGKLDCQTFYGKAPLAVLRLAQKYNKPVLFICGSADWQILAREELKHICVAELVDFASSAQEAKNHAGLFLARACRQILLP